MKNIIIFTIFTLTFSSVFSQTDYKYIRLQADPNSAFGIVDNPRTETEILGLDFDLEAGLRYDHVGIYITYGRFEKQDYQNYAAGVDYYVNWLEDFQVKLYNPFNGKRVNLVNGIALSAGLNYGRVIRKITRGGTYDSETIWGGSGAIAFRGVIDFKIANIFSIVSTLQYQQRPELNKFIIEGALGIQYNF